MDRTPKGKPSACAGVVQGTFRYARSRNKGPAQFADKAFFLAAEELAKFVEWMIDRKEYCLILDEYEKEMTLATGNFEREGHTV